MVAHLVSRIIQYIKAESLLQRPGPDPSLHVFLSLYPASLQLSLPKYSRNAKKIIFKENALCFDHNIYYRGRLE